MEIQNKNVALFSFNTAQDKQQAFFAFNTAEEARAKLENILREQNLGDAYTPAAIPARNLPPKPGTQTPPAKKKLHSFTTLIQATAPSPRLKDSLKDEEEDDAPKSFDVIDLLKELSGHRISAVCA